MSEVVNKGYEIPLPTSNAAELVALLRENFTRLANHRHSGEDSESLALSDFPNAVQRVSPVGRIEMQRQVFTQM